jgi:SynChlorMet cassette protein ScmC
MPLGKKLALFLAGCVRMHPPEKLQLLFCPRPGWRLPCHRQSQTSGACELASLLSDPDQLSWQQTVYWPEVQAAVTTDDHNTTQSRRLALADGRVWRIVPKSELSSPLLLKLSEILELPSDSEDSTRSVHPTEDGGHRATEQPALYEPPLISSTQRLLLLEHAPASAKSSAHGIESEPLVIHPSTTATRTGMEMFSLLQQLTAVVGRDAVHGGGMLLHSALAEWRGLGVILAAPGGTGKTTASRRLPSPWQSLCDDATLVVRDGLGKHWAHPWPTLSRFVTDGEGGSWQVQDAVPLGGIFFLVQSPEERLEAVGRGEAAAMLVQAAKQASWGMMRGLDPAESRRIQVRLFDNVCSLAQSVPTYLLRLSLTGAFWEELERVLAPAEENDSRR